MVVDEVEAILDPTTVNALVDLGDDVTTVLAVVTTESDMPGAIAIRFSHLGTTSLTPEQLEELQDALESVLDIDNDSRRRFLQVSTALQFISVGEVTFVQCPPLTTGDCIGTTFDVVYTTKPRTTSSPAVKSGKGSKSGKCTSAPTNTGGTSAPIKSGKRNKIAKPGNESGKNGNGKIHVRI
jgi:hypothetical protein